MQKCMFLRTTDREKHKNINTEIHHTIQDIVETVYFQFHFKVVARQSTYNGKDKVGLRNIIVVSMVFNQRSDIAWKLWRS